jgi:putative SOS response-associated peptidase YedK
MIPLYTITSKAETIAECCKLAEGFSYSPVFQARPGMKLPILIQKEGKIELIMARWGVKKPLVDVDRILSTRPYNILIRKQRCAVPANCFFSLKRDQPYLIRLLQYRLFLMGGMFHYSEGEFYFTLLQAHAPDMLNSMEGKIPVVMAPEKPSSPEGAPSGWLSGAEVGRVMRYADRAGSYWFDYFPVSKQILETGQNNKDMLKPLGISQNELKEHEKKLTALAFEKARPNRSNLKH